MRIAHVISSLGVGGAERMLVSLVEAHASKGWDSLVVSLTNEGLLAPDLRAGGTTVAALGMQRGVPNPLGVVRLASRIRKYRPDIVQTWMYHADLIGSAASLLADRVPVIWSIHSANAGAASAKWTTEWTRGVCARLSHHLPQAIVCCSNETLRVHETLGYATDRMEVIPNGFDTNRFVPNALARLRIRAELGVSQKAILIGMPARHDPQKDHVCFAEAAKQLVVREPKTQFVLCGEGIEWSNPELADVFRSRGLERNTHLLGVRGDMPEIYAALDLVTLSSISEAFPMVLGEAMSCGTPCVATNVGDAAQIIGDTGRVVPIRNPVALASAWSNLIELSADERTSLSQNARERVISLFSLPSIAERYATLYKKVSRGPRMNKSIRK